LYGELGTVAAKEAPSGVGLLLKLEVKKQWRAMPESNCTVLSTWFGSVTAEVAVIGKNKPRTSWLSRPGSKK
jgi:hypothetical protein